MGVFRDEPTMPDILINGLSHPLPGEPSVAEALAALGLEGKRVAVERNGAIVPRSEHTMVRLREGDRVEIVAAVGGG
jgi:sulfur carrier protein